MLACYGSRGVVEFHVVAVVEFHVVVVHGDLRVDAVVHVAVHVVGHFVVHVAVHVAVHVDIVVVVHVGAHDQALALALSESVLPLCNIFKVGGCCFWYRQTAGINLE